MKTTEDINNYSRCPIGESSGDIQNRSLICYAMPTCSLREGVNELFLKICMTQKFGKNGTGASCFHKTIRLTRFSVMLAAVQLRSCILSLPI